MQEQKENELHKIMYWIASEGVKETNVKAQW